jgi:hypothetical protein
MTTTQIRLIPHRCKHLIEPYSSVLTSSNLNMLPSTSDVGTLPLRRPSSTQKIDDLQTNLTPMKQQGSYQLLDWLKLHGTITNSATLECRLRKWGVHPKTATQIDDQLAD